MKLGQASLLIACLLICTVGSAGGLRCSPSSCGQLKEIKDPFRLKGDPSECGDPRYELTCNANRAVLDFYSGKYFVESISYVNKTIRISDVGLAGGGCALPNHTLSSRIIWEEYGYDEFRSETPLLPSDIILDFRFISFVNCTQKIQNFTDFYTGDCTDYSETSIYTPIPCLSGNSSFVYVISPDEDSFKDGLSSLAPSCSFLATTPFMYVGMENLTEERVFQHLKNGFLISWASLKGVNCDLPTSAIINTCFQITYRQLVEDYNYYERDFKHAQPFYNLLRLPLSFEVNFVHCLDDYPHGRCPLNISTSRLIKFLIILLDAVVILVLPGMFGRFVFAPFAFAGFLGYRYWESQVPIDNVEKFLSNQQSLTPTRYSYPEIIIMTRHFKDKLGQGGFGSVYKGELLGGFQVAVKMLGNSKCNGDDFISEVSTIGMVHHVHVVRLVGYCSEGLKRALVYEYLPKGSLDKYIFTSNGTIQRPFTWDKLNDIALGVARGIDYLHRGCDMRILHFDIKPHNILLDNCFNPKVSDFGLAKLFPKDYSMVALSVARGTIGYIAPELVSRSFGVVSYKSDVYSFGMLLLEMAGGRRNVEPKAENSSQYYYPSWIYDQLDDQKSEVHCIVNDVTTICESERKLSIVGLWCIQTRPSDRPSMSRVIEMLQAEVDTLQIPPKPFLSAESTSIRDPLIESSYTTLSDISEHESLA